MVGQTLAHYKILEKIGSGGMGDVYLAEDTKLERKVALKVLPPELAESDERRARFAREAKAIAALNHPNIVTVHSVEEQDNVHFITMELVKGKTLAELLPKKGFSLEKFFDVAIPLSDPVAAAHEQGIVHRDLKPGNVMVTDDGIIKVLDFGLARTEPALRAEVDSESPTDLMSREGVLAGTLHYMAPEQAEGKTADHRADLFALGIVFYEMLTGTRPFDGASPAATISSILKDEPRPVTELNASIPPRLGHVVRRCLNKDLRLRLQSALDLRNELAELRDDLDKDETESVTARAPGRLWLVAALAMLAVGGVLGYALRGARDDPSSRSAPRLANPVQLTFDEGLEDVPDWSPDGNTLAYHSNASGNFDIWIKQLGSGDALNRTADHPGVDQFPTWSPDGSQIAFWSDRERGGYFTMSALAGLPRKVSSAGRFGKAQWSSDGQQLGYINIEEGMAAFEVVSLVSGEIQKVPFASRRDTVFGGALSIRWQPDQGLVAYIDSSGWDTTRHPLRAMRLENGEAFFVTDGNSEVWSPMWSPEGDHLYYISNRNGVLDLWRRLISSTGEPTGPAEPLTTGLGIRTAALSRDGSKIAYSKGQRVANVWRVPILDERPARWADAEQITFGQSLIEVISVSRDGSLLIFDSDRSGNKDLWALKLKTGELRQLTRHPQPDWGPRLSPDGTEVVFYSFRDGLRNVWVTPFTGGAALQLTSNGGSMPSWAPDGQAVVYAGADGVYTVPRHGGQPRLMMHQAQPNNPELSPDGEWLLFSDIGTGALLRVPAAGGDVRVVSRGPAGFICFSADGRHALYIGAFGKLNSIWRVSLDDDSEHAMTDLSGRRGSMGVNALATDGNYLYFTWEDDLGDIWVMDMVTGETE